MEARALNNLLCFMFYVSTKVTGRATSKTWIRTLKNLDPEKHGINMGLKMSLFRELSFIKTMRNVICTNRFVY